VRNMQEREDGFHSGFVVNAIRGQCCVMVSRP
jgi:hypothetical protein